MNEAVALDRETRIAEMKKSLDIGISIQDMLRDNTTNVSDKVAALAFGQTDLQKCVEKHFKTPVAPQRIQVIGGSLATLIVEHDGITSCALWDLIHIIDHAIYDDLKDLP